MRRLLFLLCFTAGIGCASTPPGPTVDRMIDDCVREGETLDRCQQQYGCNPGMTRDECRRTLKRVFHIWVDH